jgi:hypothetical protein
MEFYDHPGILKSSMDGGVRRFGTVAAIFHFQRTPTGAEAMSLIIKSSAVAMILSSLMAVTGCSASGQTRPVTVADTSNDPSWTPPGEMDVAINGTAHEWSSTKAHAETMPQPNKREVLKHQLHAASY